MPRFFFHVHDGEFIPDEDGTDLPSLISAKREATRYAAKIMGDHPERAWEAGEWSVVVTDEDRLVLFKLTITATVPPLLQFERPAP